MKGAPMNTMPEEVDAIIRTMDRGDVRNCVYAICDLLRGKGFSPVQAEALLELAKKKLMECAVLD